MAKYGSIGAINKNKYGSVMKLLEYNNANDIWVEFENGTLVHTSWRHFKEGNVKNPFDKTVYGVGYLGVGKYKANVNGKRTSQYQSWYNMMKRGYDNNFIKKNRTYKDTVVSEEWHNYQEFSKWYDENYYEVDGQQINLDKDILFKGNKVYRPDACVFVPSAINNLFIKSNEIRGDLPIGVHRCKNTGKYKSQCSIGNRKPMGLGSFNTPEEAFQKYKEFKEKHIKEIAESYKSKIPFKLYNAMLNYKVEIND